LKLAPSKALQVFKSGTDFNSPRRYPSLLRGEETMHGGKLVFAQLTEHLPMQTNPDATEALNEALSLFPD
jgi:hypothetical protein